MERLAIDWKAATLDEVRIAYLNHLRAQAAGHRSEDGHDLVRERVLSEHMSRVLRRCPRSGLPDTGSTVGRFERGYSPWRRSFAATMRPARGLLERTAHPVPLLPIGLT